MDLAKVGTSSSYDDHIGGIAVLAFLISNDGAPESTIKEIFFDLPPATPALEPLSVLVSNDGINMFISPGGNLPGGHTIDPKFESDYMVAPASKPTANGIPGGQNVLVVFNRDYNSLDASDWLRNATLFDAAFRIGVHVINYEGGSAYRAVSYCLSCGSQDVPPEVPEPGTWVMLTGGLALLIAGRRKLRKS